MLYDWNEKSFYMNLLHFQALRINFLFPNFYKKSSPNLPSFFFIIFILNKSWQLQFLIYLCWMMFFDDTILFYYFDQIIEIIMRSLEIWKIFSKINFNCSEKNHWTKFFGRKYVYSFNELFCIIFGGLFEPMIVEKPFRPLLATRNISKGFLIEEFILKLLRIILVG